MRRLEAFHRLGTGPLRLGDRITHAGIGDLLDLRRDEADFARPQLRDIVHFRREHSNSFDVIARIGTHHRDVGALFQNTVHDADQHDDAEIGVIPAIDQHGFQRRRLIALWRWQTGDNGFENAFDIDARFRRDRHRIRGIKANNILDLLLDAIGFRRWKVDLVQHRNNFVPGI